MKQIVLCMIAVVLSVAFVSFSSFAADENMVADDMISSGEMQDDVLEVEGAKDMDTMDADFDAQSDAVEAYDTMEDEVSSMMLDEMTDSEEMVQELEMLKEDTPEDMNDKKHE